MNIKSGSIHSHHRPTRDVFEYYNLRAYGEVELYPHALSTWPLERDRMSVSCPRRCTSGTQLLMLTGCECGWIRDLTLTELNYSVLGSRVVVSIARFNRTNFHDFVTCLSANR